MASAAVFLNVPFGEWEKIPRLQAKTLVGLRYREKLPQDIAFRLRSEISLGLDNQVPQAGFLWRRRSPVTRPHSGNMQVHGASCKNLFGDDFLKN